MSTHDDISLVPPILLRRSRLAVCIVGRDCRKPADIENSSASRPEHPPPVVVLVSARRAQFDILKTGCKQNPMDYDQLASFLEVAKLQSFSRAAEKLFRTQPAISAQVRLLEQECGEKLFDRSGKKVLLTPGGRSFGATRTRCWNSIRRPCKPSRS